jgi:hypothetical protein
MIGTCSGNKIGRGEEELCCVLGGPGCGQKKIGPPTRKQNIKKKIK